MEFKKLFEELYHAATEEEVSEVIQRYPTIFENAGNWAPYGHDVNYFGIIESQQASPIPALVEKITNSIDAILTKECRSRGIDPASQQAPKSMMEAVNRFFPDWKNWDLRTTQRKQAEEIQILADGPKKETSIVIYDNGEGQHPENFEKTFLSLLKGNKAKIHFVQGKYNMGGSGALVFCGKKRYQLLGSKRFDKTGKFGFTLTRRHQLTKEEREANPRFLHYEFLRVGGEIPSFEIKKLDLGLYNRSFETGTVIKLYNYKMPGVTDISRDLNLSLNEFLFEPALPLFTIEDITKTYRYPHTPQPQRELYGLKRRLERMKDTYLDWDDCFDEEYKIPEKGSLRVYVYVFKSKIEGKDAKESVSIIQREFFKNNMAVLFSLNGQVHGSFTSEFITRTLKFRLLKDHLLIHVDCSHLYPEFRNELFMASRDRLKEGGEEAQYLRSFLGEQLKQSKLKDLHKKRKNNLALSEGETNEVFRAIAKNISLNPEMMKLFQQAFKLEQKKDNKPPDKDKKDEKHTHKERTPFLPQRFPSFFRFKSNEKAEKSAIQIPENGSRTMKFESDVESAYFKRAEEPGDIEIAILKFTQNSADGGSEKGFPKEPDELIALTRSSPDDGIIKITFAPTESITVGDALDVKITLKNPAGEDFIKYVLIKITDPEKPKEEVTKAAPQEEPLGLPQYILAYENSDDRENHSQFVKNSTIQSWSELGESNIGMDYKTIIHPVIDEDDKLDRIVINMNSSVLMDYKRSRSSQDQLLTADKRYITAVYFHTLMLYATSKQQGYDFKKNDNGQLKDSDLTEYLKDLFSGPYSSFLLNFGLDELMSSLE